MTWYVTHHYTVYVFCGWSVPRVYKRHGILDERPREELGIERRGRYTVPGGITGPPCSWGI
jgi:hypothetical protein